MIAVPADRSFHRGGRRRNGAIERVAPLKIDAKHLRRVNRAQSPDNRLRD